MSLLKKVSPYFQFTPNERKGVIVFLVFMVLLVGFRIIIGQYPSITSSNLDKLTIKQLELIEERAKSKKSEPKINSNTNQPIYRDSITIVNLQTANRSILMQVGFSQFAASNLIKYRDKGGRFYSINDLERIYGMDTLLLPKLKKQLVFEEFQSKRDNQFVKEKMSLNYVDSVKLMQIPCIGKVLARRIIKYREKLGGFYDVKQLKEVYGIKEECYENLLKNVFVEKEKIIRINLNTASENELAQHPYISNYQAKAIVKYREIMNKFSTPEQLKSNYIFTQSEMQKARPYLSTDDSEFLSN